ncbi:ERV46 [Candida oxycetoniae]|uniref:Endoplasmic reticulum-Golgi intermediate compartment protein n=1 Tax=Candida oxycetoniae TaxID=497107 RepID=A0AAI9T2C1_9ASCO|nr:ERV46 [Candida oxycetoniae]KAI3406870.2 ERV46 [Candida oxycetoniae]
MSKLLSLDAFAKTAEDARVKTTSGGIITLICCLISMILIRNEYLDYSTIVTLPELVVDRDINKQMDINLDISFLNLPCDLINIDLFDETGDLNVINSGLKKYRLIRTGGEVAEILDESAVLERDAPLSEVCKAVQGSDCGSCYGALPQDQNQFCCNNCAAVRRAYAHANWKFYDGEGIAQCEQEGYVQNLRARINENEGCRVKGSAKINRVSGTMDFTPGPSMTRDNIHVHDLSLYLKYKDKFNFDHIIHSLSFGELKEVHLGNPLDNYSFLQHKKFHLSNYYLKVVPTRYEDTNSKLIADTNQFSVITHDRPLQGGKDEDHQHTLHARGGVPGIAFHFDISPLKIINREQHAKTWSGFVLGVVSSVAGVLMVGSLLDRSLYAVQHIRKKEE